MEMWMRGYEKNFCGTRKTVAEVRNIVLRYLVTFDENKYRLKFS